MLQENQPKNRAASRQLLSFAWGVEIIGVSCGVVNAAYTTFGPRFPTNAFGWLPALPLAVIAVTELLRVPFAQATLGKRSALMRLMAIVGLAALTALALENWIFGLERVVSLRLASVTEAADQRESARDALLALQASVKAGKDSSKGRRDELTTRINERRSMVDSLAAARGALDAAHQANLSAIRQTCLKTSRNDNCARDRSLAEDQRYHDELESHARQETRARDELLAVQGQLEGLTLSEVEDSTGVAALRSLQTASSKADEAYRVATEANQIYRLASMWYHVPPHELSAAQYAHARGFFCVFGAAIIAFAGSLAALLSKAADRSSQNGLGTRIYRALRVVILRRPKTKIEVQTVEKPVYREIQKIVYVPVDPNTGSVIHDPGSETFPAPHDSVPLLKVA